MADIETAPMGGDHPAAIRGRRDARELLEAAARVVRVTSGQRQAGAADTLSTALQLVMTTALVDGFNAQEVYGALAGALAWGVMRLPPTERQGVLAAMVTEVVGRIADIPAAQETPAPIH
jgi:hypothetical protein